MNVVLYEDAGWQKLLPLVYTRAVFQLRCGMGDLLSQVRFLVRDQPNADLSLCCRPGLAGLVREQTGLRVNERPAGPSLLLNGRALWSSLPECEEDGKPWVGTAEGGIACVFADSGLTGALASECLLEDAAVSRLLEGLPRRGVGGLCRLFSWPWEIVGANADALISGWERLGLGRPERGETGPGVTLLGEDVFAAGSARIDPGAVVDSRGGPVYIDAGVRVRPHAFIEGPACIGPGSILQPHACVRGGTTLGPACRVGGEIEACILQGYGNKQHLGYLGHSYVGSWTNLGAGCTNSDLKNTYGTVRVAVNGEEVETGERFVGMAMGDHSKAGIGVCFPTGAVVGFSSSVAAAPPPKFVPSFTWIDGGRVEPYDLERALAVARRVVARRDCRMSGEEERVFSSVAGVAGRLERVP